MSKSNTKISIFVRIGNFYENRMKPIENIESIVFLAILAPVYLIYILVKYQFQSGPIVSIVLSGFLQGAFYALIAVGFSIIFGVSKMFKLSIGAYFVVGAYAAYWLNKVIFIPYNELGIDVNWIFVFFKFFPTTPAVFPQLVKNSECWEEFFPASYT